MKGTNIKAENVVTCMIVSVEKSSSKGFVFLKDFVYMVNAHVSVVVVRKTGS